MEIEPLLNTPEMETIQLAKLKTMLSRIKADAPFYTRMMEACQLDPEGLSSFDEFKEKIEPFDKQSLRDLVAACGGDLLKALDELMPIGVEDLDWIATTTGTTGVPTPYPLTNDDIAYVASCIREFDPGSTDASGKASPDSVRVGVSNS